VVLITNREGIFCQEFIEKSGDDVYEFLLHLVFGCDGLDVRAHRMLCSDQIDSSLPGQRLMISGFGLFLRGNFNFS